MKTYLPIGSIVILKNGQKKIMIYGRRQRRVTDENEYDYIACLYPEGNINEDYMYLFNHEDIDTVVYRGFSDAEEEAFVAKELSRKALICLHELEEPYKEVFMLSVLGGFSLKDISAIFGRSESWARVTFYRAKQKLLERMR